MKAQLATVLLTLSTPALSDPALCPLLGKWKSDAARTLADIVANQAMSPRSMSAFSNNFFGHMTHEWTCAEFRAWFDYHDPGEFGPYQIRESDAESMLVNFPDGAENDLRLVFEGTCYKIRSARQKYHEYFCPVTQQ